MAQREDGWHTWPAALALVALLGCSSADTEGKSLPVMDGGDAHLEAEAAPVGPLPDGAVEASESGTSDALADARPEGSVGAADAADAADPADAADSADAPPLDGPVSRFPCMNPTPVLGPGGEDTGYVSCDEGWFHRVAIRDCPSALGCTTDADCSPGAMCFFGDPVSRCVTAACTSDADCQPGFLCASYEVSMCNKQLAGFTCQLPGDDCIGTVGCFGCLIEGSRSCYDGTCG